MTQESLPPLTEAQLTIMQVVWQRDEASVSDVVIALEGPRRLARNTVLTTMQRLEEKGWLTHREQQGTFLYRATRSQAETLGEMAGRLVDTAFAGRVDNLVMTLLRERNLSRTDVEALKKLIEEGTRR